MIRKLRDWGKFPNTLTIARLILFPVPLIMLVIDSTSVTMRLWTTVTFVVIILTDKLDGWLARRWNQVSDFGKLWDPLADKFFMVATMAGMCATEIFPSPWGWSYLAFTFVRELGVSAWRYYKAPQVVIPADQYGKMKTFTLAIAFGMMLLPVASASVFSPLGLTIWWGVVVVLLVASFVGSIVSGWNYIRQ